MRSQIFLLTVGLVVLAFGCGKKEMLSPSEETVVSPDIEGMEFVFIPGGEFQMGDLWGDGESDERPVHTVRVGDFWMSKYEVTNAQYVPFLNAISGHWIGSSRLIQSKSEDYYIRLIQPKSEDSHSHILLQETLSVVENGYEVSLYYAVEDGYDNRPMIEVSWFGAVTFCNWLSRQAGLEEVYDENTLEADFSKIGYRLPTEAEWEYAARAGGKEIKYPNGNTLTYDDANYSGAGGRDLWVSRTAPVGSFPPNGLGLYDMAGNVSEWCHDWYDPSYYSRSPMDNPKGPSNPGSFHVLRGGAESNLPEYCRTTNRNKAQSAACRGYLGFRVVLPIR